MNKIMKPLVAAAIPLLTALGSYITTGTLNAPELSLAITGFATAIVVAILTGVLPEDSDNVIATWGKAIGAALTPLVSALIQGFVTGSFSKPELTTAVVGLLTAALMYFVQPPADT